MPLVIVAVTVSYVVSARLAPLAARPASSAGATAATVPISRAPAVEESRPGQAPAGSGGR
jgi:hypothetical protein